MITEKQNDLISLVRSDSEFAGLEDDAGILLLSRLIDYKINVAENDIKSAIKEVYNPTLETTLLAKIMYDIGYFRFKRPLSLKFNVTTSEETFFDTDTMLSDGENVYYLDFPIQCKKGIATQATATLYERYETNVKLSGQIYAHFNTGFTYKELSGIECFFGDTKLKYSQQFADNESEVSFEVREGGKIWVVILLNNGYANSLSEGNEVRIICKVSTDSHKEPEGLTIIQKKGDISTVATDIRIHKNYIAPLDLEEMKDIVRYGRKNNGDIVMNEDFRFLIWSQIGGFKVLKVWQEREETDESGFFATNINKVFCSYVLEDDSTFSLAVEKKIEDLLKKTMHGKFVNFYQAIITDLEISISIKTGDNYDYTLKDEIKSALKGYYDNVRDKIKPTYIYKTVFGILQSRLKDFEIELGGKLYGEKIPLNRDIYRVLEENITINIEDYNA